MIASFYFTITRDDEDVDVLVEYRASNDFGDIDVEIISVTSLLDGLEVETTAKEDSALIAWCFERVDDDFQSEADAEGDYRYDMSRDYDD